MSSGASSSAKASNEASSSAKVTSGASPSAKVTSGASPSAKVTSGASSSANMSTEADPRVKISKGESSSANAANSESASAKLTIPESILAKIIDEEIERVLTSTGESLKTSPEGSEIPDHLQLPKVKAFYKNMLAYVLDARAKHWSKLTPFLEHTTKFAPPLEAQKKPECKEKKEKHKKKTNRNVNPHVPPYAKDLFEPNSLAKFMQETHRTMPSPRCRCDICVGYRFYKFYQDFDAFSSVMHLKHCKDTCMSVFCPGQELSTLHPAAFTLEHLDFAEECGWNLEAVLTGVGFDESYKPHEARDISVFTAKPPIHDLVSMLEMYRNGMHGCTPEAPCRSWCHKSHDQLTEAEADEIKSRYGEWQLRMLACEGIAFRLHCERLERQKKKAEKDKAKKEKLAHLSKPENRWSEAPLELMEFLGVGPRIHKPTCCREFPCVSAAVCFPEGEETMATMGR